MGEVANSKRLASGDATAGGEAYGYPLQPCGEESQGPEDRQLPAVGGLVGFEHIHVRLIENWMGQPFFGSQGRVFLG